MWSEGQYDYERLPEERVPPRSHPSNGCHGELHSVPKKPPLLGKRPPLLGNRPPLLDRPGEGSYNRYYSDVGYQEDDKGRSFSHDRRSGLPQTEGEFGYPWSRYDHSASCQSDYRHKKDDFRRKSFYSSHYMRDQSSHTTDPPFYQESPIGQKDQAVGNIVPKKPPLLEKRPLLLNRPSEGSYSRYYSDVAAQENDEGQSFSHDQRNGPCQKGDECGYGWSRYDHSTSGWSDSRHMRDGFRRKNSYSSHFKRDSPPHAKDPPIFQSRLGQKDSTQNRSVSSVSSTSCSAVQKKTYSSKEPQHTSKERWARSLKTSRYTSLSSPTAGPTSEVLYEPSRKTEKELAEAESKRSEEKLKISEENTLSSISEFQVQPTAPLCTKKPAERETNARKSRKLFEFRQLSRRSNAIASKMEEIEQAYRQYSETVRMVMRRLIENDPSLEKSIQFPLRESLQERLDQCVEELKRFFAEYDASTQAFGKPS